MKSIDQATLRRAFEEMERRALTDLPEEETVSFPASFERRMARALRRSGGATVMPRTHVRRLVVLAAALALMAALAIVGSATLKKIDLEEYTVEHGGYRDESVAQYIIATDLFDSKADLTYVETINDLGVEMHSYVDQNENIYRYNPDGTLRSIRPSEKTSKTLINEVVVPAYGKVEKLSKDQAIKYASALLKKMIGEDFENYKLQNYLDAVSTKEHYVSFVKYYQGDHIGEYCNITMGYAGDVTILTSHSVGIMKDFDPAVLNTVSDKMLDAYIAQKLQEKLPECTYVRHDIESKYIKKIDGKLGIQIEVRGHYTWDGEPASFTQLTNVFYPFPNQAAAVKK